MKLDVTSSPTQELRPDLLVILLDPALELTSIKDPQLAELVERLHHDYAEKKIKKEYFTQWSGEGIRNVLVTHSSLESAYNTWEKIKILSARALGHAKDLNLSSLVFQLNGKDGPTYLGKVVEGIILGSYSFERYKKEKTTYFDDMNCRCSWTSLPSQFAKQNAIAIGW
jgi:leucyl aminopeptidase